MNLGLQPVAVAQLGAPISVSTDFAAISSITGLTVLFAFTDLSAYDELLIACVVDGTSANSCTFQVDTSQDGSAPDMDHSLTSSVIAAGNGTSFLISAGNIRKFYRLEATPSAGTAKIKWQVTGRKSGWGPT